MTGRNHHIYEQYKRLKDWIKGYRNLLLPFIILCVIYFLGLLPIVQADTYYVDDLGRAYLGYTGWETFSRYLSVYLSYILHASTYLTDISPLPQLLSVPIMAAAAIICLHVLSEKETFSLFHYAALIPFALSPYFLQCLSYKYDAPYMALSVFVSVFPFLFYRKKASFYVTVSVLCTICMCMSYQASSGIYPMMVAALCLKRWTGGEKVVKTGLFAALSAASYIIGLVLFRCFILHRVTVYASTEMLSFPMLIPGAVKAYLQYISTMIRDFKTVWMLLLVVICIGMAFALTIGSSRNKLVSLFVVGLFMAIIYLLSFGVYPFLTIPTYSPRCMYGIGVFLSIAGLFAVDNRRNYLPKLGCIVLSWMFFVFCFTYGNALSSQSKYDDYRMQLVIEDLLDHDLLAPEKPVMVRITGSAGLSPSTKNMLDRNPMLGRLVNEGFCDSVSFWGGYEFSTYYGLDEAIEITNSLDADLETLPLVSDNMLHTIHAGEGLIWIDLH